MCYTIGMHILFGAMLVYGLVVMAAIYLVFMPIYYFFVYWYISFPIVALFVLLGHFSNNPPPVKKPSKSSKPLSLVGYSCIVGIILILLAVISNIVLFSQGFYNIGL